MVKYLLITATFASLLFGAAPQATAQDNQRTQSGFELCNNGKDDNNDGLIDCADPQCALYTDCGTENINFNCADGIDNDKDGDIDCADSECDCTGIEICNNGLDDDGDGLVDCLDTLGTGSNCIDFVGCERDCNNGVDDDGDGFFDYYDGDCAASPDNPNTYIITKPDCEARPQGNVFDVNEAWRSGRNTINNRGIPIIADVDNDGTPEVLALDENRVRILSGLDGSVEATFSFPDGTSNDAMEALSVADVDNDGYGEFFGFNKNGWLRRMDYDPVNGITQVWSKNTNKPFSFSGLADFNQDGVVEIYYGNEIRDAKTGDLLVEGSHGKNTYPAFGDNNWISELNNNAVAVDILPDSECTTCNGLELVLGHVIYAVDLTGGRLTEVKNMNDPLVVPDANKSGFTNEYHTLNRNNQYTAVVDYNQDGFLDVLMSGSIDKAKGPTTVFFWDVHNKTAKAFVVTRPGSTIPNNIPRPTGGTMSFRNQYKDLNGGACNETDDCTWSKGTGSLNIANIDSDAQLECTFMSGSSLYAIDVNMQPEWTQNLFVDSSDPAYGTPVNGNHVNFWESTSGFTGTAVFDFDGDGASEVIYRDQVDLYVVDGESGRVLNSQYANLTKCSSNTGYEYPIIADVDGDGETEIIVSCSRVENEKYQGPNTNGGTDGHVRVYKASPEMFWVPARQIWNQFTYFNVNINDNLTVPRFQQPHHLNFSQLCASPTSTSRFSLNKFLNQSPRITYCGDLAFPAAQLDFPDDAVQIDVPVCPTDTFQVRLRFENNGDYAVRQPIPFSFYAQDPIGEYANSVPNPWLDTVYVDVPGGVQPGQQVDTTVTIRGARGAFTLYVSMNDIGPFDKETKNALTNEEFYNLDSLLNGTVRECDGTPTVVSRLVNPVPFRIETTAYDNRRCSDVIGTNNGRIKITDENGQPFTPLSNYELALINTRTGDSVDISGSREANDEGIFINTLDSGTYALSVSYVNSAFSCGSVVDTLRINRVEGWPGTERLEINKIQDVSSCRTGTNDGAAQVMIYIGDSLVDQSDYEVTFVDEQQSANTIVLDSAFQIANNLKALTYKIFVTNTTTGCSLNDSSLVMDLPLPDLGDPIVSPVTNCRIPPNGSFTAVMKTGNIADYEFILIDQGGVQDTLRSSTGVFTDLPEGIYEVKAYDPNNDCGLYSAGKIDTVGNTVVLPDLAFTQVSPQTACDPTKADGHLRVDPSIAGDYAYTWFKGTVTTGSTAVEVGNTADATGLYTYNNPSQLFTVVVLDNNTGCSVSDTMRLQEQITYPEPQATATARTYCSSLNGTISANVGGNTADYTFDLYEGTTATGTPDAQSADGNFSGLDSIEYTIVAISTLTGCATPAPQAFTIKVPGETKPPFVVPTVVDQSSCDSNFLNGSISVTADGSTSTADYTFEWQYPDNSTASAVTTLTGLGYGSYQLTVTDNTTGCDTTLIIPVANDILEDAPLTLTPSDVTFCDPYNGQVEVTEVNGTAANLADYTFTWYEIAESGLDSTEIVGVAGAILSGQQEGTYSVQGFNDVTKCPTSSQRAVVGRALPQPFISIDTKEPIDNCVNPSGEFELKVDVGGTNAVDDYTYDWYLGSEATPANYVHSGPTIENVVAGIFTIVATSKAPHRCPTTAVINLGESLTFLPVLINAPVVTDIERCGDLGSINAQVNLFNTGPENDNQNDYAFYWFAGQNLPPKPGGIIGEVDTTQALTSLNPASGKPSALGVTGVGHTLIDQPAGFYSLVVYNIVDQCFNTEFAEIKQIAREPVISRVDNQPQTLCSSPVDGRLEVLASKRNGDTTPDAGPPAYSYAWYAGTAATGTVLSNTAVLANQTAGQYTVQVTDLQTNCVAEQTYTILDERDLPAVTDALSQGVDICGAANGSITVSEVVSGSAIVTDPAVFASDYTFFLYTQESDYDQLNPATNSLPTSGNNHTFASLDTGTYYLAVSDNNNGCPSPFLKDIFVRDAVPKMTIDIDSLKTFITCTALNEGKIDIRVRNTTDARFEWYAGSTASGAIISTNDGVASVITDLTDGEYTVAITDLNGIACPISETFTVPIQRVTPVLFANKISDQTKCTPADGSIEITKVTLNGNTENPAGYDYLWHQGSVDAAGESLFRNTYGQGGTTYTDLPAGTYFITAQGNGTNGAGTCFTDTAQVIITDETVALEVVNDFISDPIVACDPSPFEEGEIRIRVGKSTNFTIEWYRGDQVIDSQRFRGRVDGTGTTVSLDNALTIGGRDYGNLLIDNASNPAVKDTLAALTPGIYTVRVIDTDTGCDAVRRYTIQGIVVPLEAFPTARAQTSCETDNGIVALTINGGTGDYYVNWYAGPTATGTPINDDGDKGAYRVENLPAGQYTVTVMDSTDLSCDVVTEQITVEDRRFNDLQITVRPDFPMTNCDDTNPNGQLSARIDRSMSRYEFFWYEGTNTATNPIAFGPTVTNLSENTYSVVARDRITGCFSDPFTGQVVTLLDSGLLPAPSVRMLSPVTRCINPDGSAEATLDSALTVDPNVDYEFIWADAQGKVVLSSARTNIVTQLDTGRYFVVARNTITGCRSLPGEVHIGLQLKTPQFEIITTVSSCNEPSGTVELRLNEPLEIVDITWVTPYGENNGFYLDQQPAGKYIATLTDAGGCQYTQEATVLPNIEIYNAVSPNGDQKNDIFTISCIEDYENNIVRIYNRAGSLVYQHQGYDNETIFFDGFGNQGIYVGKKELPDGTYFYIVDKRNGDQPLSGYLELLR